jgi:flavin-dependent dehydrogenase
MQTMQQEQYDVVIAGAALAGASMGLLLKRALPDARVLIIERGTRFDFKVGESTSEIAGCFLSRILRLGLWLGREQIAKNGLRFWFTTPENDCPGSCAEMGPKGQTSLPTWQLDRSTLDPHVLSLAEEAGCVLWRPATVRQAEVSAADAAILTVSRKGEEEVTVRCRWFIDATGKAALLARQRGTLETLEAHPTSSMWVRFRNLQDLDSDALLSRCPEMARRVWGQRGTATNHLTGYGWWAWIIPLRGGEVSVGLTWDRRFFQPPAGGTVVERLLSVLRGHPIGKYLLEHAEAVEQDARIYHQLAYRSTEVMGGSWAAVGDAAGFMDPLYSHGIDFIANTVYAVSRIVIDSLAGQDVTRRAQEFDLSYQKCFRLWFEALYKDKYCYLGDAELMTAATLMDVGFYFLGPVRLLYEDHRTEMTHMPYHGRIGAFIGGLMRRYNARLATLAHRRRLYGIYGEGNLDRHLIFPDVFSPKPRTLKLILLGFRIWMRCEWRTLRARLRAPRCAADPIPAPGTAHPVPSEQA